MLKQSERDHLTDLEKLFNSAGKFQEAGMCVSLLGGLPTSSKRPYFDLAIAFDKLNAASLDNGLGDFLKRKRSYETEAINERLEFNRLSKKFKEEQPVNVPSLSSEDLNRQNLAAFDPLKMRGDNQPTPTRPEIRYLQQVGRVIRPTRADRALEYLMKQHKAAKIEYGKTVETHATEGAPASLELLKVAASRLESLERAIAECVK